MGMSKSPETIQGYDKISYQEESVLCEPSVLYLGWIFSGFSVNKGKQITLPFLMSAFPRKGMASQSYCFIFNVKRLVSDKIKVYYQWYLRPTGRCGFCDVRVRSSLSLNRPLQKYIKNFDSRKYFWFKLVHARKKFSPPQKFLRNNTFYPRLFLSYLFLFRFIYWFVDAGANYCTPS